jgi:hypothetical protein
LNEEGATNHGSIFASAAFLIKEATKVVIAEGTPNHGGICAPAAFSNKKGERQIVNDKEMTKHGGICALMIQVME